MRELIENNKLTEQQEQAIALLFARYKTGMTYEEIAKEVGISQRQLLRWRTENKAFIEAYNQTTTERLRGLLPAAVDYLEAALTSKDAKQSTGIRAVKHVLQANSLMGNSTQEVHLTTDVDVNQQVKSLIDSYGIDLAEMPE